MPSEKVAALIQKGTFYDLLRILESSHRKTYTVEDLKQLTDTYIRCAEPENCSMSGESVVLLIQKGTLFDFIRILGNAPEQTYAVEDLKQLVDTYIQSAEQ